MFVLFSIVNRYLSNHSAILYLPIFFHAYQVTIGWSSLSQLDVRVFKASLLQCPFPQKTHFLLNLDWNPLFDNRLSPIEFYKLVAAGVGGLKVYGGFSNSSDLWNNFIWMLQASWASTCLFRIFLKLFTVHSSFSGFIFSNSSNALLGSFDFNIDKICIWLPSSSSEREQCKYFSVMS